MNKLCQGCGTSLQNEFPKEKGFVKDLNFVLCERCFRTTHYSEFKSEDIKYTNEDLLAKINNNSFLTLFLTDFLTLSLEVINTFKKIQTKKILIINKCDIIPKSVKPEKIKEFICEEYKVLDEIIIISSLKNKNLAPIKNIIENNKNVYITGYTNAGKSSLIKALTSKYANNKSKITTSIMPNTTLDFMKLKLGSSSFFDTPGFNYNNPIWEDDLNIIKKSNSKKEIKPVTLQTKIDDVLSIDEAWFIKIDKVNSLTFYLNNNFEIKKVYNKEITDKNLLNIKENTDLIIKGIGFINFKKECTIEISFPLEYIEKRISIFS